jgi:hypothetical protein
MEAIDMYYRQVGSYQVMYLRMFFWPKASVSRNGATTHVTPIFTSNLTSFPQQHHHQHQIPAGPAELRPEKQKAIY